MKFTSAGKNSIRLVIAGKTAQNPSQYRQELQIVNIRAASTSGAFEPKALASKIKDLSCCMGMAPMM